MNRYFATFLFSMLSLAGCDNPYNGDGRLSDAGSFSVTDRYVLNLGNIDLWKDKKYQYNISNLPNENFVFGIASSYQSTTNNCLSKGVIDKVNIQIVVTDEDGIEVISQSAPIKEWVWSHAKGSDSVFGYRRCEEVADQRGYFACKEGTGTYFTPSKGKQYSVELVVSGDKRVDSELIGTLLAKSGGWK